MSNTTPTGPTEQTPDTSNQTPAALADPAPAGTPADETPEPEQSRGKGNAEAARYRTRLREVEAERDELTQKLAAQERELWTARALAAHPHVPEDKRHLLRGDTEAEVAELAEALSAQYARPGVVPLSGTGGHAGAEPTWADAVRQSRGG